MVIASQLQISYSRFHRLFKEYTGIAPIPYIIQLKWEKAKENLVNISKSVKEISPAAGTTLYPQAKSGGRRALLPIPAAPFTEGFYAVLQNEVFVNVGDPSTVNGKFFDQNSAYVAFGYRFTKQFDTEFGYVNQYISGAGDNSTNNPILQCATYIRL